MNLRPSVLIIAPHIDDELIGCWSVLNDSSLQVTVLFLEELTTNRRLEALACAERFGFLPLFADDANLQLVEEAAATDLYEKVFVPSRKDWHAAHKRANAEWREYATHFYSVDMANGKLLATAEAKQQALDALYPSQRDLWRNDQKYWLFEDICTTDYDVYKTLTWHFSDGQKFSITALVEYSEAISSWYRNYPRMAARADNRTKVVNAVLGLCPTGKVTIEYGNERIEA